MNSKIKFFLLCPVPEDQKPINEYIGLKENPLTNWTTLSQKNYLRKLGSIFIFFFSVNLFVTFLPFSTFQSGFQSIFRWIQFANLLSFKEFPFFLIILIVRWEKVKDSFENARLIYEEASWYDTQVWEKPFLIIKNDQLISMQRIRPILDRLWQTFFVFVYFNVAFFFLFEF